MDSQQFQVAIKLHISIEDNEQAEQTTTTAIGSFYKKNRFDVLAFDEQLEEHMKIKNLITIQPGKISIKRSGAISMHQQFRKNQPTENVYKHPHGNFHMVTFTNQIDYQPIDETNSGKLTIYYTLQLNGQEERRHELTLLMKKENPQ